MSGAGKIFILVGVAIALTGVVLMVGGRFNLPLGRLPGDFSYKSKNLHVYLPLGTSLLISLVLSLVLWLINRR